MMIQKTKTKVFFKRLKNQWQLQVYAFMGIAFLIVFCYVPMSGLIIAFKDWKVSTGYAGYMTSDWTSNHGMKYFIQLFSDPNFAMLLKNTLYLSLLKLIFSFPAPIIFALALNEVNKIGFKRVVQTVSYLPHFISWVVVYGLIFTFLNTSTGLVNNILLKTGKVIEPVNFLANAKYYWQIAIISDVWKELGWWSIIFLAAITCIDPSLYEAAKVDGANRIQSIFFITLPAIKGTISIMLILSLGALMAGGMGGSNFDQAYLMSNSLNYSKSAVLPYYVYQTGLLNYRYSFATAVGLFQSFISLFLVLTSNYVSRKISGYGLF